MRTESLRRTNFHAPLIVLGFLVLGTLLALVEAAGNRVAGGSDNFGYAALWMQPPWLLLGALAPCVVWVSVRFPIDKTRWARSLPVHFVSAFAFTYGHLALLATLHHFVFASGVPVVEHTNVLVRAYMIQNLFIYCTVVGGTHAWRFYRSLQRRELDAALLQSMLSEARLEALRHQIQPHFFFNTLNTVVMFARNGDTRAVVTLLTDLSSLLRYSLEDADSDETSIQQEMEFLRQYLAIEQVRFGNRLRVTWDVDPSVAGALVPRLLLQPLVENAVRHGLARIATNAELSIRCRRAIDQLVLEVEDNGPGVDANASGDRSGIGLRNIEQRLDARFGSAASLQLVPRASGGTIARITLPITADALAPRTLVPCA
jgi:two-component system, LytTR family, sensor kinase